MIILFMLTYSGSSSTRLLSSAVASSIKDQVVLSDISTSEVLMGNAVEDTRL